MQRYDQEGTVDFVNDKCGFVRVPNLDGTIFIQPTSFQGIRKGFGIFPSLCDLVSARDKIRCNCVAQPERKGCKWKAIDGSVVVLQKSNSTIFESSGRISKLDSMGINGYIESERGTVYFAAQHIRPTAKTVDVFKEGQLVKFKAVENPTSINPWRALIVCRPNYKPEPDRQRNGAAAVAAWSEPRSGAASAASSPYSELPSSGRERHDSQRSGSSFASAGSSAPRPHCRERRRGERCAGDAAPSNTIARPLDALIGMERPIGRESPLSAPPPPSRATASPPTDAAVANAAPASHFSLPPHWSASAYAAEEADLAALCHRLSHVGQGDCFVCRKHAAA